MTTSLYADDFLNTYINNPDFSLFVQNFYLIHSDIYDCTKYGICHNLGQEANPVAAYWINQGKYNQLFFLLTALNTSIYFNTNHLSKNIYFTLLNIAEINAISTWQLKSVIFEYNIKF